MSKFKVGDKVRKINANAGDNARNGWEGVIVTAFEAGSVEHYQYEVKYPNRENAYLAAYYQLELISNNNNTIMELKNKFVQIFLAEPEKSFRKAGITNGDGMLTEEGQSIFLTWLLKREGESFKKEVVDEIVKEEEK